MLGVRDGYQNDAACTAVRAVRSPIVDHRTQWMVLSAAINNPEVASCLGGTHGGLLRLAVAKHARVIVDSDEMLSSVVGRAIDPTCSAVDQQTLRGPSPAKF